MRAAVRKAVAVAFTLGPRWTAQRSMIEFRRRSGLVAQQSPCLPWDSFQFDAAFVGGLVSPGKMASSSSQGDTNDPLARSQRVFGQLSSGAVQVFDIESPLGEWNLDPLTGFRFASGHWSKIVDGPDVDVKLVWEASRFGWALDLLRVAVLGKEPKAADLFWSVLADWMASNPPNNGVNWRCGQESSIRLIHCLVAAEGLGTVEGDRQQALCRLADVTARRVLAFIDYAVSQNNNHSVSEAMGLIAASSSFPDLAVAERSMEVGLEVLANECRRLVFDDGSTSQYSMGYHRVFVEGLLLARMLLERRQLPVPDELVAASDRAVDFLSALVDPVDGSAPLYGEIDGGHLLPLSSCPFTDFRPTVALGHAVCGTPSRLKAGPWDELRHWFGVDTTPNDANGSEANRESSVQVFRDAGVSILRAPAGRVTIRAGGHRFRPAQADQLHVDVWLGSNHVAMDPGTWSYRDPPAAVLKDTLAHNTVALPERGQMPLISQFLWGDWVTGNVTAVDSAAPSLEATHDGYEDLGVSHHRRVEPTGDGWLITDRLAGSPTQPFIVSWLLAGSPNQQGPGECSLDLVSSNGFAYQLSWSAGDSLTGARVVDDTNDPLTWRCDSYRSHTPVTRVLLNLAGSSVVLRSRFQPIRNA